MARWTHIAQWRGPASNNFGDGDYTELEPTDAMSAHLGLVVHIAEGTLAGTLSWELNSTSDISSHFIVGRDGTVYQMVDTHDRPWTQRAGNYQWLSVECEGFTPASAHYRAGWEWLTDAQITALAKLLLEAHKTYGVPLQVTSSTAVRGLGHHSMGADWGHQDCPGPAIISQKPAIVARAVSLKNGVDMDLTTVIPNTGSWNADGTRSPDRTFGTLLADVAGHVLGLAIKYDTATSTWKVDNNSFWPQSPASREVAAFASIGTKLDALLSRPAGTFTDEQVQALISPITAELTTIVCDEIASALAVLPSMVRDEVRKALAATRLSVEL